MQQNSGNMMRIETPTGDRLYLTQAERERFETAAALESREVRTFCDVLLYTGCRLSEALELTAGAVELSEGVIRIESLKKRRKGIFRRVPVPPAVLDRVDMVHGVRDLQKSREGRHTLLWTWSRTTAWRKVNGSHGEGWHRR